MEEEFRFAQLIETIQPRGVPNPNPIAILDISDYKWKFDLPKIKIQMLTTYNGLPAIENKFEGGNVTWKSQDNNPLSPGWFRLKVKDRLVMHWVAAPHVGKVFI